MLISSFLLAVCDYFPLYLYLWPHHYREICDLIHSHGGQVYLDGANMNAQVTCFSVHIPVVFPHGWFYFFIFIMCSDTVLSSASTCCLNICNGQKEKLSDMKNSAFFKTRCKKGNYFYNVLFYELPGSIVCVNVMNRWESVGLQTMGQTSHTWTSTKLSVSPMEGADQGWDPSECKRKSLVKVYFFVRQVLTKNCLLHCDLR